MSDEMRNHASFLAAVRGAIKPEYRAAFVDAYFDIYESGRFTAGLTKGQLEAIELELVRRYLAQRQQHPDLYDDEEEEEELIDPTHVAMPTAYKDMFLLPNGQPRLQFEPHRNYRALQKKNAALFEAIKALDHTAVDLSSLVAIFCCGEEAYATNGLFTFAPFDDDNNHAVPFGVFLCTLQHLAPCSRELMRVLHHAGERPESKNISAKSTPFACLKYFSKFCGAAAKKELAPALGGDEAYARYVGELQRKAVDFLFSNVYGPIIALPSAAADDPVQLLLWLLDAFFDDFDAQPHKSSARSVGALHCGSPGCAHVVGTPRRLHARRRRLANVIDASRILARPDAPDVQDLFDILRDAALATVSSWAGQSCRQCQQPLCLVDFAYRAGLLKDAAKLSASVEPADAPCSLGEFLVIGGPFGHDRVLEEIAFHEVHAGEAVALEYELCLIVTASEASGRPPWQVEVFIEGADMPPAIVPSDTPGGGVIVVVAIYQRKGMDLRLDMEADDFAALCASFTEQSQTAREKRWPFLRADPSLAELLKGDNKKPPPPPPPPREDSSASLDDLSEEI